jgi:CelD/BcsL family acetyltransferase involved in cellulose biosynthesis
MTGKLQFKIEEFSEIEALAAAWRALELRSNATFFLSWDWIGTWIAAAEIRPQVLVGSCDNTTVLLGIIVPTCRRDIPFVPIYGMHLQETGDRHRDIISIEYNGFLTDKSCTQEVEFAAIRFLLSGITIGGRRRDELQIRGALQLYEGLKPPDVLCTTTMSKRSWRVDLCEIRASGKSYLDHLGSNTRYQIRRSIRRYETFGPLTTARARDVAEGLAFFDGLKELHQAQWTRRGEMGGFAYPFFESFHRNLICRTLARGATELFQVGCHEKIIGYLYNFNHQGSTLAYASGFLFEEDEKLKPGLVSHYLCIEHHLREGGSVYDFMAGDYRYKRNLGTAGPQMVHLLFQRPTGTLRVDYGLHALKKALIRN